MDSTLDLLKKLSKRLSGRNDCRFKEYEVTIEKEEEFAPKIDLFACSQLCNFRKSCEYRPKYEPWKNKKKNKK